MLVWCSLLACTESPSSPGGGGRGGEASSSAGQGGSTVSGGDAGGAGTAGLGGAGGAAGLGGTTDAGGSPAGGANTSGAAGLAGGSGSAGASGTGTGTGCSGRTLCWDFEEGALPNGWTKRFDEGGQGQLLVDDTKAFGTSKYALHAKGIQGGGPRKTIIYQLPASFGPVLWGRARVYTSPTRPDAHAGLFAAYYPPVGSNSAAMNTLDWYEVASFEQAYMSIWHPPWPPGFPESVQVSDTRLVLEEWTCLEWQFDGQNGNEAEAARPRVWLDGTELAWPTKFAFSEEKQREETEPFRNKATSFTVVETGVTMWQAMPTPNDWWIDDLAVGTQRVGCQ